jgi:hypothetical protein
MNILPSNVQKRANYLVAIALFITLLAPILFLSLYTRPHADDFFTASIAARHDIFSTMKFWYTHWTGRYFSFFLVSYLNPMTYDCVWLYPITIFCMLLLQLCTSFFFLKKLAGQYLDTTGILLAWALLNSYYYAFIPGLSDGVYWLAGSFVYLTSIILTPWWLLVLLLPGRLSAQKGWWFASALAGGVAIIGSNELALLTVLIVSFLNFAWRSLSSRHVRMDLLLLFALLTGFAIFEIAAPGNYARAANVGSPKVSLFRALYSSFALGELYIRNIIFHTPFLIILLVIPPGLYQSIISRLFPRENRFFPKNNKWVNLIFPLAAWGVYASTSLPGLLSGVGNISRTLNYTYFMFIVASILSVAWLLQFVDIDRLTPGTAFIRLKYVFLLILAAGLYVSNTNNLKLVYEDIATGNASRYSKVLDQRFTFLDTKRNSKQVDMDSLHFRTFTISPFPFPQTGDQFHNTIVDYQAFYQIGTISLR